MNVVLVLPDREITVEPLGAFARASCGCPACGRALDIVGKRPRVVGDRHYESDAYCVRCHAEIGVVRAYPDTLFGIEEDEAVLVHGRARVYGGERRSA